MSLRNDLTIRCLSRLLALLVVCAWNVGPAHALESYFEQYRKIEKAPEKKVDYTKLRSAWALSDLYNPYLHVDELYQSSLNVVRERADSGDFKGAAKACAPPDLLFLTDIRWHELCERVSRQSKKKKHQKAADFHAAAKKGLLESILSTGDGKSEKTAYRVITVNEEYALAAHLGFKVEGQRLSHSDISTFDVLNVTNEETGESTSIYFNIDRISHWLKMQMKRSE